MKSSSRTPLQIAELISKTPTKKPLVVFRKKFKGARTPVFNVMNTNSGATYDRIRGEPYNLVGIFCEYDLIDDVKSHLKRARKRSLPALKPYITPSFQSEYRKILQQKPPICQTR